MLSFIIQQVLLSLILIVIIHYIYIFLKDNLTEPKIKDLVNKPKAKYNQIYNSISTNSSNPPDSKNMKTELQDYLKELSIRTEPSQPAGSSPAQSNNLFDNNYESL